MQDDGARGGEVICSCPLECPTIVLIIKSSKSHVQNVFHNSSFAFHNVGGGNWVGAEHLARAGCGTTRPWNHLLNPLLETFKAVLNGPGQNTVQEPPASACFGGLPSNACRLQAK